MSFHPTDVRTLAGAIVQHGPAPNARMNLQLETQAADEAIQTGVYVSWMPNPNCILEPSAADEIKNGTGQCCHVGTHSFCRCGHQLSSHKLSAKLKTGYNKPPPCSSCKRCNGFEYTPHFPEECGQWWLSRRPDFNIADWRKVRWVSCYCVLLNLKYNPCHDVLDRGYATHLRSIAVSGVSRRYPTTRRCSRHAPPVPPAAPQWMKHTDRWQTPSNPQKNSPPHLRTSTESI